jgi:hypothetical protein
MATAVVVVEVAVAVVPEAPGVAEATVVNPAAAVVTVRRPVAPAVMVAARVAMGPQAATQAASIPLRAMELRHRMVRALVTPVQASARQSPPGTTARHMVHSRVLSAR